jgi:hypothetical protein
MKFHVEYRKSLTYFFLKYTSLQVCFSDEATVQIMDERHQFVRRRLGEELLADCVKQSVKYPDKIMLWSVISWKGTGPLYAINGTMRKEQYIQILENCIFPNMKEWFPENDDIFTQDGAPCHTAKAAKMNYLHGHNVEVLGWPGNSPDMNPDENIWEEMKDSVSKTFSTTKQQLTERLLQVCYHDQRLIWLAQREVESMSRRIQALIKAKGGPAKY